MPGERFTARTRAIIDYLHFARSFDQRFPGFGADVHGLRRQMGEGGMIYSVDCLALTA
ncbi:hypothetical protein D3C77_642930 [compost metagenome]